MARGTASLRPPTWNAETIPVTLTVVVFVIQIGMWACRTAHKQRLSRLMLPAYSTYVTTNRRYGKPAAAAIRLEIGVGNAAHCFDGAFGYRHSGGTMLPREAL